MNQSESNGWDESAGAWIASLGDDGDFGRQFVLDAPMLARVRGRGFRTALDLGCGEGRFCRLIQPEGIATIGVDPTQALLTRARELDPHGDYRLGRAEDLDLPPASVDLVVSYLSLIDIPDLAAATARIVSVLRPGGTFLIANLTSFNTAAPPGGWMTDRHGQQRFCIDHYLEERATWVAWRGIRIQNWHRPLSTYMSLFLAQGLELRHFAEPPPTGGDPRKADRYRRVPFFQIMEWEKPG
ncbi:MAG: class I SAM-dependent methyltransferase [Bryobacteraceae bacterium]|nr:class I SAM-dependent methyltransferase [Bryobacteraceae bacterium]